MDIGATNGRLRPMLNSLSFEDGHPTRGEGEHAEIERAYSYLGLPESRGLSTWALPRQSAA